jgi:hypothetical protein
LETRPDVKVSRWRSVTPKWLSDGSCDTQGESWAEATRARVGRRQEEREWGGGKKGGT